MAYINKVCFIILKASIYAQYVFFNYIKATRKSSAQENDQLKNNVMHRCYVKREIADLPAAPAGR
ncbi:MAG: hypothetical protein BGP14_12940 [Sphingobacteriales bacterium 44-15]|nr:MAG: hypothetical protein BGP14_12940 [Sphingobacteriales bacterium 44-15]